MVQNFFVCNGSTIFHLLGTLCAVKIIDPAASPSVVKKARREIAVMRACGDHPALLKLYDAVDNDGFLLLELQLAHQDLCDEIMQAAALATRMTH